MESTEEQFMKFKKKYGFPNNDDMILELIKHYEVSKN